MTQRRFIPGALMALGLAAFLALGSLWARPEGKDDREKSFQDIMSELAKKLAKLCQNESQTAVAVGGWTDPPEAASSAGPKIQSALIEALGKLHIANNAKAAIVITGEYEVIKDEKDEKKLTLQLSVKAKKKGGKTLEEYQTLLGYGANEDLIKLLAITGDYEGQHNAGKEEKNEQMKQDYEKPKAYVAPASPKAQVAPTSPYAVEILAGKSEHDCTPRQAALKENQIFVDLKPGDVYQLKIHNNSEYEVAAEISIDGVDVYQFYEPAAGRPKAFLVASKSSRVLAGWKRDAKKANVFQVGKYENSANYQTLKNSAAVGTINVVFKHCWEKDKTPDLYKGSRATVLGKEIELPTKVVPRTIGPLVQSISVRYTK